MFFIKAFTLLSFIIFGLNSWAQTPHFIIEKKVNQDGVWIDETITCWHHKDYTHKKKKDIVDVVGTVMPVLSTMRHTKINEEKTQSFDVKYVINDLGLRIKKEQNKKERFLILAGDSNTFGIGLKDEETLDAVFESNHPGYAAYNFGHNGGSANNTLALLSSLPWSKDIKEDNGHMVYIFYPNWMLSRIIGSKEFVRNKDVMGPWYEVENKKLVYKGKLKDKWQTTFYNFIDKIDYFNLIKDLPRTSEDHLILTAEIFKEMNKKFLERYPNGHFTVALSYYNTSSDRVFVDRLAELLTEKKVSFVKIHQENHQEAKFHLVDHHFSYEGQKMVEKELSKKISF